MNPQLQLLGACCRALAVTPHRLVRPRRPDQRLLAVLGDRPTRLPEARRRVKLTAMIQAGQTAPAIVVAEGALRPARLAMGMTTFLVEHPKARFLVDPAMCADVHRKVLSEMPVPLRTVVAPDKPVASLSGALGKAGLRPAEIDFALTTHLHWDHVSGLNELPGTLPVRVLEAERDFALGGTRPPWGVVRGPLRDRPIHTYELDGPPVLTFTSSHDLFGDGAVIVVDLVGHTPGSVGVLLALADGSRVLLAGDAAWHSLQIRLLREKAPFPGDLVDADRDAAFTTLHRLHTLPPQVTVVAGHDRAAAAAFTERPS